jgi:hypothetical protein
VRRESNQALLSGLVDALRRQGLATGEAGFNYDFHAIRHHGQDVPLERHYVPKRSQRTRSVLTFLLTDAEDPHEGGIAVHHLNAVETGTPKRA